MNPIHIHILYCYINFNIAFPFVCKPPKQSLPFGFSSSLSLMLHCQLISSSLIWASLQCLTKSAHYEVPQHQFPPSTCYDLPLSSERPWTHCIQTRSICVLPFHVQTKQTLEVNITRTDEEIGDSLHIHGRINYIMKKNFRSKMRKDVVWRIKNPNVRNGSETWVIKKSRTEATFMKCLRTMPGASNFTTVNTKWEGNWEK